MILEYLCPPNPCRGFIHRQHAYARAHTYTHTDTQENSHAQANTDSTLTNDTQHTCAYAQANSSMHTHSMKHRYAHSHAHTGTRMQARTQQRHTAHAHKHNAIHADAHPAGSTGVTSQLRTFGSGCRPYPPTPPAIVIARLYPPTQPAVIARNCQSGRVRVAACAVLRNATLPRGHTALLHASVHCALRAARPDGTSAAGSPALGSDATRSALHFIVEARGRVAHAVRDGGRASREVCACAPQHRIRTAGF